MLNAKIRVVCKGASIFLYGFLNSNNIRIDSFSDPPTHLNLEIRTEKWMLPNLHGISMHDRIEHKFLYRSMRLLQQEENINLCGGYHLFDIWTSVRKYNMDCNRRCSKIMKIKVWLF